MGDPPIQQVRPADAVAQGPLQCAEDELPVPGLDPDAMQLRYSVALTAIANFLMRAGNEEEIAHKFIELASAFYEGRIPFLHPRKASGRTYDSQVIWNYRCYVVIGLECILRSGK